jgi:hypothetical protein
MKCVSKDLFKLQADMERPKILPGGREVRVRLEGIRDGAL